MKQKTDFKDRKGIVPYEGVDVPDGKYKLGQLSNEGRYGRVVDPADKYHEELFNGMPVMMSKVVCLSLFNYIKTRPEGTSIKDYTATVKNHQIIHIE